MHTQTKPKPYRLLDLTVLHMIFLSLFMTSVFQLIASMHKKFNMNGMLSVIQDIFLEMNQIKVRELKKDLITFSPSRHPRPTELTLSCLLSRPAPSFGHRRPCLGWPPTSLLLLLPTIKGR